MEHEPSEQDEIIEMARQAGMEQDGDMWFSNLFKTDMDVHISHLEHFAKLVAAKEREACAKKCETARETIWEYHEEHLKAAACNVCTNLAIAIRARGEA
jgi:hypothetical protein